MATITEIKEKVIKARNGVQQLTAKAILDNEKAILDLVREDQLYDKGIDGFGKKITPEYAGFTVDLKSRNNKPYDRVTLKDSGAFYSSFTTDYNNNELDIFATDPKTSDLKKKYGENIDGMTKENQIKLSSKFIRPSLIKYLRGFFK